LEQEFASEESISAANDVV